MRAAEVPSELETRFVNGRGELLIQLWLTRKELVCTL